MHLHGSLSLAAALIACHVLSSTGLRSGPSAAGGGTLESGLERSWEAVRPFIASELRLNLDHARSSTGLRSGPMAASGGAGYAVFGAHKHASSLMGSIAGALCVELRLPFHDFVWGAVGAAPDGPFDATTEPVCGEVNYYEDMRVPLMKNILEKCPGIRAVRIIRQPSDAVQSDYVYTKHLQAGEEVESGVKFGERLRNIPLADGLDEACNAYMTNHGHQTLEVHQYFQANSEREPNLLEVEFNDFTTNYSATVRKIFAHWVGEDSPVLEALVSRASYWDLTSSLGHNAAENQHISPADEKAQAAQEMKKQFKLGNKCMEEVKVLDEQMGYNSPLGG